MFFIIKLIGNAYFDNLLSQIGVRYCFLFLKQKIPADILNSLHFISINMHRAKVSKKFLFLDPRVKSPKNKHHEGVPYSPAFFPVLALTRSASLKAFPKNRSFAIIMIRLKVTDQIPGEFLGLVLLLSSTNPQVLCLLLRRIRPKTKVTRVNI